MKHVNDSGYYVAISQTVYNILYVCGMIIYNETIIVDEAVHKQWLHWMQDEYIPMVMKTGHFNSYKILNVIDSPNEGVTYCIQYLTDKLESYNHFDQKHRQGLQAIHQQRFENQLVLFNSLMQTVN
jgi:hypothetical protein